MNYSNGTLSDVLRRNANIVSREVSNTIREQLRAGTNWQRVAKEITAHDKVADVSKRATELARLAKTMNVDRATVDTRVKELRRYADQLAANDAPTGYLKQAYKNLTNVVDARKPGEAVDKALQRLADAKIRYNAERISRTEIGRAYNESFRARIEDDPDVTGYRWVLSSRHHVVDECTMIAEIDNGAGPGIYAKGDFPNVPIHPNCLCSLVPYTGEPPKRTKWGTVYKYLESVPEDKRAGILGRKNATTGRGAAYKRGLERRGIGVTKNGEMEMQDRRRIPPELIQPVDTRRFEENVDILDKDLTGGGENSILNIGSSIEHRQTELGVGVPADIYKHGTPLNDRQQRVLDNLPEYDSRATFDKQSVSMNDLSALTAKMGDEFAMFTRGSERLVVRGNSAMVNISSQSAKELQEQGYKWSGHTHSRVNDLVASEGDMHVLAAFSQNESVIYDPLGNFKRFFK